MSNLNTKYLFKSFNIFKGFLPIIVKPYVFNPISKVGEIRHLRAIQNVDSMYNVSTINKRSKMRTRTKIFSFYNDYQKLISIKKKHKRIKIKHLSHAEIPLGLDLFFSFSE